MQLFETFLIPMPRKTARIYANQPRCAYIKNRKSAAFKWVIISKTVQGRRMITSDQKLEVTCVLCSSVTCKCNFLQSCSLLSWRDQSGGMAISEILVFSVIGYITYQNVQLTQSMGHGLCNDAVSVCEILPRRRGVRRVCCCEPGGREISVDSDGQRESSRSSTAFSSKCEQCHVYSRRRRLKTALYFVRASCLAY